MIYITEFGVYRLQFLTVGGERLNGGQRLRGWPTLKSTILKQGSLFQLSDILYTVPKLKMTLYADITHITQSNKK